MQIPSDVSNFYMFMGYAVVVLLMVVLIGYMIRRTSKLSQEYKTLRSQFPQSSEADTDKHPA